MRQLDPDDPRAPYLQVAECIRDAIAAGEYPPGIALPSRARLAEHFGVAPMTVQNALRVHRDEGVVVSRQGSGVYVRQTPTAARDPLAEIDALRARVKRLERLLTEQGHAAGDLA